MLNFSSPMASSPTLRLISECFIQPEYTKKEALQTLYLAPWDLAVLSASYVQRGFLFAKPITPIETLLDRLKDSLSTTLVDFYSLAGQLESCVDEEHHTSLIFLDCKKGPGVRFIHSALDITISDLLSSTDDEQSELIHPLFDHNGATNHDGHTLSLLTVKVTEFDDGVFIAISINHACADGESIWHFLNAWSKVCTNKMDKDSPVPLRLPVYKPWFPDGSGPIKLPFTHPDEYKLTAKLTSFKDCVFHFSAESIARLKVKANTDCGMTTISSLQALAALLWRCITRARVVPDDAYTQCGLAFNVRGRLRPPLSPDYFGSAMQERSASCSAGELLQHTLGWAARMLNEIVVQFDDRKVRDGIQEWIGNRVILPIGASNRPNQVVFVGSPKFDAYGVELGMGKPLQVMNGYGFKFDGKVLCTAGRVEGSVDMVVSLSPDCTAALESDQELLEASL